MSAKKSGRKQFNLMLKYLKSHKDINKLLVEKTDRITRNFKVVVDLDEVEGLELHFVKEGAIISEKSQDAHNMFLHGTIEDKRFITQTVLSNATYYNGKLDVELHPVFDTLFRLSKEYEHQKSTIEPSESCKVSL